MYAANIGMVGQIIKIGARGVQVSDIQNQLQKLGYGVRVDGIFGPETRNAVVNFQKQYGIIADGIVGPQTQEALQSAIRKREPVIPEQIQKLVERLKLIWPMIAISAIVVIVIFSSRRVENE